MNDCNVKITDAIILSVLRVHFDQYTCICVTKQWGRPGAEFGGTENFFAEQHL